jgi:hypothetical protein
MSALQGKNVHLPNIIKGFKVLQFNSLTEADNYSLLTPFSALEVREVVWSCDGNNVWTLMVLTLIS